MKYTIHGLQQKKLLELGLTNDDALILSVLKDRYSSMNMDYKIIKNQRYIWVDYSNVIENDIPILYKKRKKTDNDKASKSNLMSKIKKYAELGLIKRETFYEKNGVRGTYAFVCLTSKFDYLTEYEKDSTGGIQKKDRGYPKKRQGVSKKKIEGIQKKDNKDYPTRDYTTTEKKVVVDEIFLSKFKEDFKKKYHFSLHKDDLEEMFITKGKNVLIKYFDNFQKIIDSYVNNGETINNTGGLFKSSVMKEFEIPKTIEGKTKNNKPIQATNYEQREYDDDFFNSLYDNIKFIKKEE